MKRILITGAGSYVGTNVERYLNEYNKLQKETLYQVETISTRGEAWKDRDFSVYDTVFHVAGIAHADVSKVAENEKEEYYRVNCDLAVETALKAKTSGVKQFVYMSSMIVYGDSAPFGKSRVISKETIPVPANFYGDSKWQAEKRLQELQDELFQVALIRAPFLYGKGCKGNYVQLVKLAHKLPVFPDIKNERSMLYIENFCEFVRLLFETREGGIFCPQNAQYSATSDIVKYIADCNGKKIFICRWLNPFVWLASKCPGKIGALSKKAFGNMVYEKDLSDVLGNYQLYDLRESIERTEKSDL